MEGNIQPVGDIEGGILGCAWSNDQEMFLIVTSSGSLLLLNNSFEVLEEQPLENMDTSVQSPVLISWRSDGENVSVNFPLLSGERCIAVFTRELRFVSTWYCLFFHFIVVGTLTKLPAKASKQLCLGILITLYSLPFKMSVAISKFLSLKRTVFVMANSRLLFQERILASVTIVLEIY